ncbi:MAG TPA: response regulator, partial [Roseiflexaceae bacterium]|nr:response regulator [Roseiflexaceae bacterium]
MTIATNPRTYAVLLVEDNPGDVDLIKEYFDQVDSDSYQVLTASSTAEARQELSSQQVDVVLLDLSLPDSSGTETVRTMRAAAGDVPIVVLTGAVDEALGLACIDAGAQDFLPKNELRPILLRRAVGYAVSRLREAQLRALQEALEHFRAMSSSASATSMTATLAGVGPLRTRYASDFKQLVDEYFDLLGIYLSRLALRKELPRETMERLITELGDRAAGPRDLIDVHLAALDDAVRGQDP